MTSMDNYTRSFIESARERHNIFHEFDETQRWLKSLQRQAGYEVEQVPLEVLDQWYFETDTGNLKHRSDKFFSIVGLDCTPVYADAAPWQQPIISQPEVGILGILTKEFAGVRYFLMQAKMEPGNINKVQISPTLQATYSNYTRVLKGKSPAYLGYFLDANANVIRSQFQSETGSRFFRKFNNNILLDLATEVEVLPGYRWLTLYELQCLMAMDNAVNMDSRSVLSNVPYNGADFGNKAQASAFFGSISCAPDAAYTSQQELRDWLVSMRARYSIDTRQIPLRSVKDWVRDAWGIHHVSRNYFTIVGVRVEAMEREIPRWSQPLLKHQGLGLAGFLCANIKGVLHFLMQAKPEPGIVGSVELGPTVSVSDYRNRLDAMGTIPFMEYFLQPGGAEILHSSIQSEEGGRFWNLCNHYLVIKVPTVDALRGIERYEWMTLEQLQRFSQGESMVNSEARTLLSCLQYFP